MHTYKNVERQRTSKQKVPFQTKASAVPASNQTLLKTIIQRAEQGEGNTILPAGNRTGLPDHLKSGIEALSGYSMDPVRVHFNSPKPAQLQAHAYTKGTDIHVAPGQEKHLPHEAWHVVQQMQGRVMPTDRINGININSSSALEWEADVMGARAARMNAVPGKALQMKKPDHGTAQLVPHVELRPHDAYGAINLTANEKPTIVFETMSKEADEAQSVFNETKKYSGNTICVFGLNKENEFPAGQINIPDVSPHFFRSFAFKWSTPIPGGSAQNNRYRVPFIEARKLVMEEAKNIVENAKTNSGLSADDPAGKFIYRWIDGDAKDDRSEQIPKDTLEILTDGGLSVLSGTYRWRTASPEKKAYSRFISMVNRAEKSLRYKFFEIYGKLSGSFNYIPHLPDFIEAGGVLGDYYLPETTLMMSETAHNIILGGNYGAYIDQEQSKESMRMLSAAGISTSSVAFEPLFSASKPLKGEFAAAGENYLGAGLLNILKQGRECRFEVFYEELCNMRQSIFEKFKMSDGFKLPPKNRTFEEHKRHLALEIYNYYIQNSQKISQELSDV